MPSIVDRLDDIVDKLSDVSSSMAVLAEQVRTMRTETVVPRLADHSARLRSLEAWRWWQLGASAAAGAVSPEVAHMISGWLQVSQ